MPGCGSPRRPRFVLAPSRAALLVIDLQRHFCDPAGRSFFPGAAQALAVGRGLIATFRAAGRPVAFTRHGHRDDGDLGAFARFYDDHLLATDPEGALMPGLEPTTGDAVFVKSTYDAFLGTSLEPWLVGQGVSQIVLAGVCTHRCVDTTARAAFCRGLDVFVVADACAARREGMHEAALATLADSAAVVLSAEEVCAACARTS